MSFRELMSKHNLLGGRYSVPPTSPPSPPPTASARTSSSPERTSPSSSSRTSPSPGRESPSSVRTSPSSARRSASPPPKRKWSNFSLQMLFFQRTTEFTQTQASCSSKENPWNKWTRSFCQPKWPWRSDGQVCRAKKNGWKIERPYCGENKRRIWMHSNQNSSP